MGYTYFHAMNTTTLRGLRTACRYQRIQSGISPRISSYSSRSPSIQSTTFLLFRYASTTTTSSNKETTSSKQHPVNGPLTTLPAPLPIPPRLPLRPRQILRRLLQNWHKEHLHQLQSLSTPPIHHRQEPFLVTRRSSQSRVINPL